MAHYWDPDTRSKALEPVERKACVLYRSVLSVDD